MSSDRFTNPEQGKNPLRTGRSDKPQTGRIGQLALMQMQSSSRLLATNASGGGQINNSQIIANIGYGGDVDQSSMMKQTVDSINARDSSYNGRLGRFQKGMSSGPMNDNIQVRIRGKNNEQTRHTGSITRTMGEMGEEKKRKQEIAKAANRLKMLEKLEEYRERKMNQEIAQLEQERQKEEEEIKKARDKEKKYAKYLERQREKLAEHNVDKQAKVEKEKKEAQLKKKKDKELQEKKKKEHEKKKKEIAEYKQKKAITAEFLANADLDYDDEDDEDDGGYAGSSNFRSYDVMNSEEDASRFLDQMLD